MRIKQRATNLAKKYHTRSPYELASYLNIEVVFRPMKRTHGFCDRILKRRFIVINSNLPDHLQKQTCAHELGHIVLHKGWGYLSQGYPFNIRLSPENMATILQLGHYI
ncbi:MAG: hypothetical protein H6Q71_682 [Firmicutes bacterium]|nr:hypothetical protein [Bacillota bacterium]